MNRVEHGFEQGKAKNGGQDGGGQDGGGQDGGGQDGGDGGGDGGGDDKDGGETGKESKVVEKVLSRKEKKMLTRILSLSSKHSMDTKESGRKPALVQIKKRMEKRGGDTMNKVQSLNKARRRRKRQSVIAKKRTRASKVLVWIQGI